MKALLQNLQNYAPQKLYVYNTVATYAYVLLIQWHIPYSGTVWRGESLLNLGNRP